MQDRSQDELWRQFGISQGLVELANQVETNIEDYHRQIDRTVQLNQMRVIAAFQEQHVSDFHLHGSTGYGYGDLGREALDAAYARLMGTEAAIVRPHFVSGTHAIACAMLGNLQPGDELILGSGQPYDTLETVIGLKEAPLRNSLLDRGVSYKLVPLDPRGDIDLPGLLASLSDRTKMIHLQRSRGYAQRPALSLERIAQVVAAVRARKPEVIIFVDNCYGEFVATQEPGALGADLLAGSLIKNPGGGLAISGGYIAGREDLVARAAERLTAPGLGREMGATGSHLRPMLQGLFLAPHVVGEALKGAIFAAALFQNLGFAVSPNPGDLRQDIIQAVQFGSPEQLIAFCQGIQAAAPVDAHVRPEPGRLPGYTDPVIMAAGTFVLGGSLELSADGPVRPPYTAFFQGGLTYAHARLGVMVAASRVLAVS
ncbi:MAG: aminotransferase class I/II-fold pyridoxal phosphate-dependent enzyme [Bacillota bacterium]|jgi:cystathionine beta-lyase family protein involved in aluminum resistance